MKFLRIGEMVWVVRVLAVRIGPEFDTSTSIEKARHCICTGWTDRWLQELTYPNPTRAKIVSFQFSERTCPKSRMGDGLTPDTLLCLLHVCTWMPAPAHSRVPALPYTHFK